MHDWGRPNQVWQRVRKRQPIDIPELVDASIDCPGRPAPTPLPDTYYLTSTAHQIQSAIWLMNSDPATTTSGNTLQPDLDVRDRVAGSDGHLFKEGLDDLAVVGLIEVADLTSNYGVADRFDLDRVCGRTDMACNDRPRTPERGRGGINLPALGYGNDSRQNGPSMGHHCFEVDHYSVSREFAPVPQGRPRHHPVPGRRVRIWSAFAN